MPIKPTKTFHDHRWRYDFNLPRLDIQRDFKSQAPGFFSRLIGVDGRYSGRLKRFPGWIKKHSVDFTGITIGGTNVNLWKPFAIKKGATGTSVVRGVVFLGIQSTTDKLFAIWSDNDGDLSGPTVLETFASPPTYLDVAVDHQLLYVVGEEASTPPTRIEFLARYAGATGGWVKADWVSTEPDRSYFSAPLTVNAWAAGVSDEDKLPGFLSFGSKYGRSYRLVFPEQGFVGPLEAVRVGETGTRSGPPDGWVNEGLNCYVFLSRVDIPSNYGKVFSRCMVQVFRTPDVEFFDENARGRVYLEGEFEVPRLTVTIQATRQSVDAKDDYNPSDPSISDGGGIPGGASVGDTIYMQFPLLTRGAASLASDKNYGHVIFRREITAIVGNKITFDRSIGPKAPVSTLELYYWICHTGDGNDSSGRFATSVNDQTSIEPNDAPCYVGWAVDPSVEIIPDTTVGLDDHALALQPSLTSTEFSTFNQKGNPHGRFIAEHENLFVRITAPGQEAAGQDVLRWGFTDRPRKGLVPVLNRRLLSDLTDSITGLVRADPFLVAVLNNGLLRLHKSGDRMAVDTVHNRFGSTSVDSAIALGTNLYVTSPSGVLLFDLTAGQVDVLNATQHFFDEGGSGTGKWGDDLANIDGAYDAQLGALMFLNKTKFEMLVIWMNHGVFTHLIDVPFDKMFNSGDLQTGGLRRALFFNATAGSFHEIDGARDADSRTTFSYKTDGTETSADITYIGITTATTSDKLVMSTATFVSEMVGHFVRVRQSSGLWKRARITARDSATTLSIDANIAISGQHFSIGAIPLQFTAWPLSGHPEIEEQDLFSVRKVTSMGIFMANASRTPIAVDANDVTVDSLLYQLFERNHTLATSTTASSHAEKTEKPFGFNTTTGEYENALSFGKILRNSPILVPGVEVWSSNMDLDLLSMVVEGKIERSITDTRPS